MTRFPEFDPPRFFDPFDGFAIHVDPCPDGFEVIVRDHRGFAVELVTGLPTADRAMRVGEGIVQAARLRMLSAADQVIR